MGTPSALGALCWFLVLPACVAPEDLELLTPSFLVQEAESATLVAEFNRILPLVVDYSQKTNAAPQGTVFLAGVELQTSRRADALIIEFPPRPIGEYRLDIVVGDRSFEAAVSVAGGATLDGGARNDAGAPADGAVDAGSPGDGAVDGGLGDSGMVSYRSHATSSANSAPAALALPRPADVEPTDLLVAFLINGDQGPQNWVPPTGWSQIGSDIVTPNPRGYTATAWYKIAGASEPADYTWTVSVPNQMAGTIVVLSGVDPANPIDAHQARASNLPNAVNLTTVSDDALLLLWGAADSEGPETWSNPDGMNEHFQETVTGTFLSHVAYTGVSGPAGLYLRTLNGSASERPVAWLVAIAPQR